MTAAATAESMREYYARRAAYYERVYFKPERQADLRAMEAWLGTPFAGREVLEIACGTGWWTPHGAREAASWLATDLNPETMALARAKPLPDVRALRRSRCLHARRPGPTQRFSGAFAGCWWSHVPLARLAPWLELLHARLRQRRARGLPRQRLRRRPAARRCRAATPKATPTSSARWTTARCTRC